MRPPALCTFHRRRPSNSSNKDAQCYGPSDCTTGLTFAASTRPLLPLQTVSARSEPSSITRRRPEIPKTAGEMRGTVDEMTWSAILRDCLVACWRACSQADDLAAGRGYGDRVSAGITNQQWRCA